MQSDAGVVYVSVYLVDDDYDNDYMTLTLMMTMTMAIW